MLRVLPDKGDLDRGEVLGHVDNLLPQLKEGVTLSDPLGGDLELVELQALPQKLEKPLLLEEEGDLVHGLHVVDADHLLEIDLAARGDLADGGVVQQRVAAASNLRC